MKNLKLSQFAGSNFHYAKYSFEYFLESMERLDIHLIELYSACPHFSIFDSSIADVRNLFRKFKKRNIAICCTTLEQCTYPLNIASEDVHVRERTIQTLERMIEYTAMLECPYTQVLGGRGSFDLPEEDAWKRAVEGFIRLSERGKECGVTMVIEECTRYTSNVVYSTPLTKKIVDEVNSPYFKAMLDNCATETAGEDFASCVEMLGEAFRHMHFADGTPGGHLIPGEGQLDLLAVLRALDDNDYKGAISFELYNRKYELEPELYMRKCFEFARALF